MEGSSLKHRLRSEIRQRRKSIDPARRQAMDRAINRALLERVQAPASVTLAAFWPFDGEPDLKPALKQLGELGARIALPVIMDDADSRRLTFRVWREADTLVQNSFGIEEPGGEDHLPVEQLDFVFLPLVAWDASGNRLGMGAGYYDRALAPLARSDYPRRIGIAYELQKTECLPTDPWDVRLHEMITESGWFTCQA